MRRSRIDGIRTPPPDFKGPRRGDVFGTVGEREVEEAASADFKEGGSGYVGHRGGERRVRRKANQNEVGGRGGDRDRRRNR